VPAAEVGVAYVHLSESRMTMPLGWLADLGIPLSDTLAVVGELGRSGRTEVAFGIPVSLSVTTYQGGVRMARRTPRLLVFGQVLGGLGQFGGRTRSRVVSAVVTLNAVSMQFGGGVVVPLTDRVGIRGGLDYRYAVMTSTDLPIQVKEIRVAGGLIIGFGER
jgi:hypothetical protein